MIEIKPAALYARADLAEMLGPLGVDFDGRIAKVKPARRFRLLYFGEDLPDAIRKTPTLPARDVGEDAPLPEPQNRGGRRRRGQVADPLDPLKQLMRRDDDGLPR